MRMMTVSRAPDGTDAGGAAGENRALPEDALIIVPIRNTVVFPGTVFPITLGRERSVAAAQAAVREEKPIGLLMQRNADEQDPAAVDLHGIGTLCNVLRYLSAPDGTQHLVVQGVQRFQIRDYLRERPFLAASVLRIEETDQEGPAIEAARLNLQRLAIETLQLLPQVPNDLVQAVQAATSPTVLSDLVAAYLDITSDQKQELLETVDQMSRMEKVSKLLAHRIEVLRITNEIGRQTKQTFDERQREAVLREQMAAIQRQLGEGESQGKAAEVAELAAKIEAAGMPADTDAASRKELRRYERSPEASPETGMLRNHLEWMVELPWRLPDDKPIDIAASRQTLDRRSFRADQDQAADRRISRGPQARAERKGADPVLRRAARRGQDLARPIDRPRARPSVHPGEPRRRSRRSRDPGASLDLYRGAAGQHHPGTCARPARAIAS